MEEEEIEKRIQDASKQKMRCRRCIYLNWDFLTNKTETFEEVGWWYCGLHGGAHIDPDGPQQNLNTRGGCGFCSKIKQPKQLSLFG